MLLLAPEHPPNRLVVPGAGMVIIGWDWDGTRCESAFRGQASRNPEISSAVETLLTGAPR